MYEILKYWIVILNTTIRINTMINNVDVGAENDEYEGLDEYEFIPDEEYDDESDIGYNELAALGVISL